jgi:predicted RND superfamily exporter protein
MRSFLAAVLDRLVLDRPWLALLAVALICAVFAWFVPRFQLDASADSLLLEQDSDLLYYRQIVARYGSDDYLVITYTAHDDLFVGPTYDELLSLRNELRALPNVEKVVSILDVPLISGPDTTLTSLQQHIPVLENADTDREMARRELSESPVYSNLLMSPSGNTTALLVRLTSNPEYNRLIEERDQLRAKSLDTPLTVAENQQEQQQTVRIKLLREKLLDRQQSDIIAVRGVLSGHNQHADLHLGGLPMIVSDMIDYIRSDIAVFGSGILLFLIVLLSVIFGRPRWVVVALLCCAVSVLAIVGLLGMLDWRVTVVSSNFVALMLIFSLSLTVHLIQRYRELHAEHPQADQRWLVRSALRDKASPCLFTALTTMVGFGSLLISGIRPVIDFGWMMMMGMVAVLITAFVLFPATLMFVEPGSPRDHGDSTQTATAWLAGVVKRWPGGTVTVCGLLAVASLVGMGKLKVENRFIDYFKESTEIHQGMLVIDRELGGTMPLDVVLDAEDLFTEADDKSAEAFSDEFTDEFADEFVDEFSDELSASPAAASLRPDLGATSYWYNSFRLEQLREVHDYLDGLTETGKVLSMVTTLDMLQALNQDEAPDTFFLSVLYKRLPAEIKETLVDPYLSADGNQIRLSMRIYEADDGLNRDALLRKIRTHLVEQMGYQPDRVHLTGMLVLYNNVLQSLYRSQILTLGVVFLAIMVMFGVLFRSIKIALFAVVPSILSVGIVLGVMGWLGISLDIMTITIAAISVGIGVDDSIHYIHRYRQEMAVDDDPLSAMQRSHASVGRAMFYTSVIVIAGFSILALSNFIPSILFGLLTGLAMFMALIANLTLLPLLLRWGRIR